MKLQSVRLLLPVLCAIYLADGCASRPGTAGRPPAPKTDWHAISWISDDKPLPKDDAAFYQDAPAPLFRRAFTIPAGKKVDTAELEIAALGMYDVYLNGKRLGETSLMPLWTPVAHRILSDTYPVADLLRPGENVLAVELGNGWYNPLPLRMWGHLNLRAHLCVGKPCFKARLSFAFDGDDAWRELVTDGEWKTAEGPLLRNNLYLGTVYDAQREIPGWRDPGFDDAAWRTVATEKGAPGDIVPRQAPALRASAPLAGTSRWFTNAVQVVDFGINGAGIPVFHFGKGKPGEKITIRYGELLHPDGSVNPLTQTVGQIKKPGRGGPGAPSLAEPLDIYIRRGDGAESYTPKFTWHAFRYAQVEGLDALLTPQQAVRYAISSDVRNVSSFECSNPALNRLHAVCRQTFLSNLVGVQSDCPGRERFGYGADIAATAEAFILNFDMRTFYLKTLQDFADEAASKDGWLTETAPFVGIGDKAYGNRAGPIGWSVGFPVLMEALLRYYGDAEALRFYPVCARYVRLLQAKFPDHKIPHCIGDHLAVEKAPTDLTGTANYYQFVKLTASLARKAGYADDAGSFEVLADDIRTTFLKRYTKGGKVGKGIQGEQAYGLYLGLLPESCRPDAVALLVQDIRKHGRALTTGLIATKYMLETLAREGENESAGDIVLHRGYPGWMYMLDNGATTLWENWKKSEDTYSNNHPMLGSVDEWLMKHLLGLDLADDAVGADKFVIRPQPVKGVTWARGHYDTPHGRVSLQWKFDKNGNVRLALNLPGGVTARVWIARLNRWVEVTSGDHQW